MILKIKKDAFGWLYVETTCFEIQSTYDDLPPKHSDLEPKGLSYGDVKEQNLIVIERLPKDDEKASLTPPLKTTIFTDNGVIDCIGEFTGFVLNDKGQTVERL